DASCDAAYGSTSRNPREGRDLVDVGERPAAGAKRPNGVAGQAHQPPAEHLEVAGLAIRLAEACVGSLAALGREVEDRSHDLRAGHAVDDRVVDLREHGHAPALEAVDQIDLPQGPGAVERSGDDARD